MSQWLSLYELALWQLLLVMRQAVYTERENRVSVLGLSDSAEVGCLAWFTALVAREADCAACVLQALIPTCDKERCYSYTEVPVKRVVAVYPSISDCGEVRLL